jgi:hypothetical protein
MDVAKEKIALARGLGESRRFLATLKFNGPIAIAEIVDKALFKEAGETSILIGELVAKLEKVLFEKSEQANDLPGG